MREMERERERKKEKERERQTNRRTDIKLQKKNTQPLVLERQL